MDLQNQPATDADVQALRVDLHDLRVELKADMGALEHRIEGRMDTLEQRMTDRFTDGIRESETRLLQAFYSFAETNNKRFVQGEAATAMAVSRSRLWKAVCWSWRSGSICRLWLKCPSSAYLRMRRGWRALRAERQIQTPNPTLPPRRIFLSGRVRART